MTTTAGITPGAALDLATGQGRNALYLAGHGWTVTAVDISVEGLRRAREAAARAHVALDTVQTDIDAYDYGVATWDHTASGKTHSCKRMPPSPSGYSRGDQAVIPRKSYGQSRSRSDASRPRARVPRMAHTVYTLDVRLQDISPPIWRTIEIVGSSTLEDLHFAIQVAMGWTNSHLHQFVIGDASYGMVDVEGADDLDLRRRARVPAARSRRGQRLVPLRVRLRRQLGTRSDGEASRKGCKFAPAPLYRRRTRMPARGLRRNWRLRGPAQGARRSSHQEHKSLVEWSENFQPEHFAIPRTGRDLRREMDQLKALAEEDDRDEV